ncbi:hypothetical protein H8356DRAFT_1353157 [Neocallimastix lanati (nom. inval.)]|nr:hypothetical protein H8356DRAFT_1353157 [Neocallimastix sp. JGI-2020a]
MGGDIGDLKKASNNILSSGSNGSSRFNDSDVHTKNSPKNWVDLSRRDAKIWRFRISHWFSQEKLYHIISSIEDDIVKRRLKKRKKNIDLISVIDDDENALPLHQEYKIYTKKKKKLKWSAAKKGMKFRGTLGITAPLHEFTFSFGSQNSLRLMEEGKKKIELMEEEGKLLGIKKKSKIANFFNHLQDEKKKKRIVVNTT